MGHMVMLYHVLIVFNLTVSGHLWMVSLHSGLPVGAVRATRLHRQDTSPLKMFSVEVIGFTSPTLLSMLQKMLTFLKPSSSRGSSDVSHVSDVGGVPALLWLMTHVRILSERHPAVRSSSLLGIIVLINSTAENTVLFSCS